MSTFLEGHCGSQFWNWSTVWETNNPDFTQCFQKTVLIWIPCGFLCLCLPFEIYYVIKRRTKSIPWTALNITKLILNFILLILSLVELFYWVSAKKWMQVTSVYYYSTFIRSLSFVTVGFLILFHRLSGRRSSSVLFMFWLFLTVSATIIFRSCILSASSEEENSYSMFTFACCIISYPLIVMQLILSTFSDKVSVKFTEKKNQCPMINATLLSLYLFSWFDKMCYTGFRRPLTNDDLWELLDKFRCANVFPKFYKHWKQLLLKLHTAKKKPSILSALGKTFWIPFSLIGLAQFGASVTEFTTPFVLKLLIEFVDSDQPKWRGYLYCCLIMFNGFLAAYFYSQQHWIAFRMGIQLRASLISAIYRKAIRVNSNFKGSSTTGEIVNLMSIDTENLNYVLPEIHCCWVGVLQIFTVFYLLWNEIGISILASVATLILIIPINAYVARCLQRIEIQQMKFKDQRIKLMSEILAGIKVLKLYAWENSFGSHLNAIRNKELKMLRKNAYLDAAVEFMFGNLPILLALSTFITYTLIDENNVLNAEKIFVTISLINILQYPFFTMPTMIIEVVQAKVSIKRLNKFLNQEELDPNSVSHDNSSKNAIEIVNGTFAWTSKEDAILKNIDLICPPGHLVAVMGPVGCGKSSLISAVLGEMEKRSGFVNAKGTIAYVAQQAWILNTTFRNNIVFGSKYNKRRYDKVIDACALKSDLELLPGGDQIEIGERGINLSGGQKQRISLARAVYSNADIILLDDPLSAVDAHVGKYIFDKVIGPAGLLRTKTRLYITNSIADLQQVDLIVVVSEGEISEVGSYEELVKANGAFAEFLLDYGAETNISETSLPKNILEEFPDSESRGSHSLKKQSSWGLSKESASFKSKPELSLSGQINNTVLIESETAETGQVRLKIFGKYFKAIGIRIILVSFTSFVLSTTFGVLGNFWLSEWSKDPTSSPMDLRIERLTIYGALGLCQVTSLLIGCLFLATGSIRASRNLHNSMLISILRCPLSFFDTTPLGRILNRFSKDIDLVDNDLAQNIYPVVDFLLETIAIIVVVTASTPLILVVIVPVAILYYFVQRFYISSSRQLKRLEFISHSPIFSHFSETLFGTSTIRAYGRTNDFVEENEKLIDEYHKCAFPSLAANRWLGIRLQLIGSFVSFSAALFAVIAKDSLDPGTMGLTVSYASTMVITLTILVESTCELEANIVSVERISEYTNVPSEAPAIIEGSRPPDGWPNEGEIIFNDYETRYRDGLNLVLKGLTCKIFKKEKIGIVGRTGAGKSSLALALFRVIEPSKGRIVIDNVDTNQIGLADLRSRLTIIPQDPVLFSGTLRMNLDPFEIYTNGEIWRALEQSHLDSFVSSLPNELQHEITEGGENLSVGQRQLVCLARALLRKTKVLVLDEATAAVDLETDELVQETIRKEFADCTVITIAHRLNTIMDCTRIMVLDQGKVQEFDEPINLLNDTNSIFYSLAKDAGLV